MQKPGKISALLLGAMISMNIFHFVIGDPFFNLRGSQGQSAEVGQHHDVLDDLMQHILPSKIRSNFLSAEYKCIN